MNQLEAIAACKTFRKRADELLQDMKAHKASLLETSAYGSKPLIATEALDYNEVIAQHTLSTRDLESCIMRQGMALKYIGTPDPYPQSRNPESSVVEPTADGLKL